jgi:hypothetical protein
MLLSSTYPRCPVCGVVLDRESLCALNKSIAGFIDKKRWQLQLAKVEEGCAHARVGHMLRGIYSGKLTTRILVQIAGFVFGGTAAYIRSCMSVARVRRSVLGIHTWYEEQVRLISGMREGREAIQVAAQFVQQVLQKGVHWMVHGDGGEGEEEEEEEEEGGREVEEKEKEDGEGKAGGGEEKVLVAEQEPLLRLVAISYAIAHKLSLAAAHWQQRRDNDVHLVATRTYISEQRGDQRDTDRHDGEWAEQEDTTALLEIIARLWAVEEAMDGSCVWLCEFYHFVQHWLQTRSVFLSASGIRCRRGVIFGGSSRAAEVGLV